MANQSNQAQAQLREIAERLNALDEWFTEAEEQRAIWLRDVERKDRDISRVNQAVADVKKTLLEISQSLVELTGEKELLEELQATQAAHVAEHMTAAYRLSGQDFLKQLLNQESPDKLDRMLRYHRIFSESRLTMLAEYRETLTALAETNATLNARQTEEIATRDNLEAEQNELSSERKERAGLIANLDRESETKTQEYERLQKDRARLEALLVELRRRSTELDGTAFARAKGTLPMPVKGRVRHAYGAPRADNRLRWTGIDIAAPHDTPVTAVFPGRVVFSDWLRGYGFLTIVDHGSDYMTLYGHVDTLFKKVGDRVESGEPIAAAGNSGGAEASGVYFEVRHKGKPADPITWVRR